jgi:hypothetical protein
MGHHEFMPSSDLLTLIGQFMCHEQAIAVEMCANILFMIGGYDSGQLNRVSVKFQCSLRTLHIQLAEMEMI